VAVQPVAVAHVAAGEAGGTVQVIRAAEEGRDLPFQPQGLARPLLGDRREGPLQSRGMVRDRDLDGRSGGVLHAEAPASTATGTSCSSRRVRKRFMHGTANLQV